MTSSCRLSAPCVQLASKSASWAARSTPSLSQPMPLSSLLEETFRLNAPLVHFPERKFYPGRYVSAAPTERLALSSGWSNGLDLVARVALDPALPIVIIVHDGPPAATVNPFEAALAAKLASDLAERVVASDGSRHRSVDLLVGRRGSG